MRACRHCGKENTEDATVCVECGLELGDSVLQKAANSARKNWGRLFCGKPASLILILLTVVYAFFALLNAFLGNRFWQDGKVEMARFMFWGAFWNAWVAAFCFAGRQLIRRNTRVHLLIGTLLVTAALLIVMRTWIGGILYNRAPGSIVEPLFILPALIYVIVYAYRESNQATVA